MKFLTPFIMYDYRIQSFTNRSIWRYLLIIVIILVKYYNSDEKVIYIKRM